MSRADLRTPSTLLVIRAFGTADSTFTPAHDIVHMSKDNLVTVGQSMQSQVGSLPVPGLKSIHLPYGPSGSFVHTGHSCILRTITNKQMLFIERSGDKPETMYDLVSPDDKTSVVSMIAGNCVQMKEGDVIVLLTRTDYNFDPDHIGAVIVALPALDRNILSALRLAAIYNRIKDFLACHTVRSYTFTMDSVHYANYGQNMGMDMQAMNELCVMDFPPSYWGLETCQVVTIEEPPKKKQRRAASRKRVVQEQLPGRSTRSKV